MFLCKYGAKKIGENCAKVVLQFCNFAPLITWHDKIFPNGPIVLLTSKTFTFNGLDQSLQSLNNQTLSPFAKENRKLRLGEKDSDEQTFPFLAANDRIFTDLLSVASCTVVIVRLNRKIYAINSRK